MTIDELSQLYWLGKEIERDTERLRELEIAALPAASVITGMPKGRGAVGDRVGRYAAEIADLRGIIQAKVTQCIYERARLERYIASVPDSLTRQIMTLRFERGLTWRQVAACIGGGNSEDSVRKNCTRYLDMERRRGSVSAES